MPAAAAKLSQGELVEAALLKHGDAPTYPLVDIGANLADPAFNEACALSQVFESCLGS